MAESAQGGATRRAGGTPPARLLVALDPFRVRPASIETAARLARSQGLRFAGLIVQEPGLRRAAALPFTQELRLRSGIWQAFGPDDVEAALRAHVRKAERLVDESSRRFGLDSSVQVVHGPFPGHAFELAGAEDLVFVDRSPGHSLADRGYRRVVTLFDGGEAAGRALRTAAELAQGAGLGLTVVLSADEASAQARLRAAAARLLADVVPAPGRPVAFRTISGLGLDVEIDRARLRAVLTDPDSTLLVLPAVRPALPAELVVLFTAVRCSIVVLR